jgi:adhesin transport system outer membrane protein
LLAIGSCGVSATTIDEAVLKGLSGNPQVRAAQSQEAAASNDIEVAKGGYYPSVSVAAGPRNIDLDGISYDVTAAQMLYDWGRTSSRVSSARAAFTKQTEQVRLKRDQAALEIVEAYLDILVTQRQVAALEAYIGKLGDIQTLTTARSEGNYADRAEPERSTLEVARAQEQLAIEKGTLINARHRYALLVGEEADQLVEPQPASVSAYVARNDLERIIHASPVARTAAEETHSAQAELGEAKASILPQLNIEASTTRRDIGGIPRDDTIVGLRFRMSNIQGISNFLRPRSAEQRVQSAIWNEGSVERDTRRDVQTLFDSAAMMRDREASLATQVSASQAVGETYLDQFSVGRRDLLDLLTTRRENYEANRQLINIRIDLLRVEYRAAAKLGLIGPLLEKGLY